MTIVAPDLDVTVGAIFDQWLGRFADALQSADFAGAARCVAEDGFWKDALAFTWSYRTFAGRDAIEAAMSERVSNFEPRDFRLSQHHDPPRVAERLGMQFVEGFFDFDTTIGTCTGFARLPFSEADPLGVDAAVVFTTLRELHGFEEKVGPRRPSGIEHCHNFTGDNWLDARNKARAFTDRDPDVVIVGGGQSGLALAATCGQMGVDALLIEKNVRIGDNWRNRYHTLTLHNEVVANDLPYMPFPPTWPTYTPKDKYAGWLESYAEAMELNVWTATAVVAGSYDDTERIWTLTTRNADGTERTVRTPHVVMAGGSVSSIPNLPDIPGLQDFSGRVLHSSEFGDGRNYEGQRALVIGTGTSGHDVAQTLHGNAAQSVTLMQRRPTYVLSLVPGSVALYSPYAEGLPIDDVDMVWAASPFPVLIAAAQMFTEMASEMDRELHEGLTAAGFEISYGHDKTGLQGKYLRYGGRYYINVGCSELIMDGSIGLVHARDMDRFTADGLLMADGTLLPLDVVVLATGYKNQQEGIRQLFGDEVAERVGPIWGFDSNNELRGLWKQTGQQGLWAVGGNLLDVRIRSRWTAVQLKAALLGILPTVEEG